MALWKHVGTQNIDIGAGVYAKPGETFEADLPYERVLFYTQIGAIVPAEEDFVIGLEEVEEDHGYRS